MKKAKSVKSETKNKKEEKSQWQKVNEQHSPIVTETNHPDEKLLEKSAKHTKNNKKSSKTQPQKQQPKEVESKAKTQKHSWVTKQGYFIRFRFVVGDNCPKSFKKGQTKLFYAKSLEHLADRLVNIKYLEAWVEDTERFNEKTQKWEVIAEYN